MRAIRRSKNLILQKVRRDRTVAAEYEGIAAAWDHAADAWKRAALEALLWLSGNYPTVTSEDVWARLDSKYPDVETHENSAMGGIFTTAASRGWITSTGRRQQSARETNHREITIWASNLYLGPDAVDVTTCAACEGHGTTLEVVNRYEKPILGVTARDVPTVKHAADDRGVEAVAKKNGQKRKNVQPRKASSEPTTHRRKRTDAETAAKREAWLAKQEETARANARR